jgi:hypothetical protein
MSVLFTFSQRVQTVRNRNIVSNLPDGTLLAYSSTLEGTINDTVYVNNCTLYMDNQRAEHKDFKIYESTLYLHGSGEFLWSRSNRGMRDSSNNARQLQIAAVNVRQINHFWQVSMDATKLKARRSSNNLLNIRILKVMKARCIHVNLANFYGVEATN